MVKEIFLDALISALEYPYKDDEISRIQVHLYYENRRALFRDIVAEIIH